MKAKIDAELEDLYYKVYITDSLKGIFGGLGGEVNTRFYDLIKEEVKETRTADEIIEGIRNKMRR